MEEPPKIEKPTAMGITKQQYELQVTFFKLFKTFIWLPTYVGWAFIPLAILESEHKRAKFGILFFVVAMWALEVSFCIGHAPSLAKAVISNIVPQRLTFAEAFIIFRITLPFIILLMKVYGEVFYYKIYEKHDDSDDKLAQLSKSQAEKCKNIISVQSKFISYLNNNRDYDDSVKENCTYFSWELNKVLKELTESSEAITKLKSKGSILGFLKSGFFVIVLLSAIFS